VQFNAQVSKGFRLGGINDPLNLGLCSPQDIIDFDGNPTFKDEKTTNYEIGTKSRFSDGRVILNASVFYTDIEDLQVITDAGECSSRIVLNGQGESVGAEVELFARPDENWDFGVSATYARAEVTEDYQPGNPVAGIREGNRLATSPKLQAAATAAFTWSLTPALESYVRFTAQHVGSSYTQLADQEAGFGVISNAPGAPPLAARLIDLGGVPPGTTIEFDTELPAYDVGNLRWGIRADRWEASLYINNLWDERAFLSIDRERNRSARVGYLTNPPRTFGASVRLNF
jgi:iron complex outermembrane receptor protein